MAKTIITYNEYGNMVEKLTGMIEPKKKQFKFIYGIPRGGVPIAVHLSHHLDIPIGSKEQIEQEAIYWDQVLVVDDLTDTGVTLWDLYDEWFCEPSNQIVTATLIFKPRLDIPRIFKPDYFVMKTLDWITFPWERKDEIPNRDGYL